MTLDWGTHIKYVGSDYSGHWDIVEDNTGA